MTITDHPYRLVDRDAERDPEIGRPHRGAIVFPIDAAALPPDIAHAALAVTDVEGDGVHIAITIRPTACTAATVVSIPIPDSIARVVGAFIAGPDA